MDFFPLYLDGFFSSFPRWIFFLFTSMEFFPLQLNGIFFLPASYQFCLLFNSMQYSLSIILTPPPLFFLRAFFLCSTVSFPILFVALVQHFNLLRAEFDDEMTRKNKYRQINVSLIFYRDDRKWKRVKKKHSELRLSHTNQTNSQFPSVDL